MILWCIVVLELVLGIEVMDGQRRSTPGPSGFYLKKVGHCT